MIHLQAPTVARAGEALIADKTSKMMAHNLSAHALSSALDRRSSPYLSQDHMITSRHIPILSVPDILEAFHQSHPSGAANLCNNSVLRSTSTHIDPWDLPELKWLDPAEHNGVGSSDHNQAAEPDRVALQSLANLCPEKFGLEGGERWLFSELYAGDQMRDQMAANSGSAVDDSLTQFSLQSMVTASTASPASSGSSMLRRKTRRLSTINMSNFASRDSFPTSGSTPLERCTDTATLTTPACTTGLHKRPAPSDRPDSDLTQEISNSGRSESFKVGAENFVSDRLISKRESPSSTVSTPPEKRKRVQDGGEILTAARDGGLAGPGPEPVQKTVVDKGSASNSAVKEQAVSPGGETSKKSAASVAAAAATATTVSDHEIHIWTERERRKKMNGMFTTLHSLLPHLTSKADKSTIVDEAINYIQSLEVTMKGMLKRKCEMANSSRAMLPSSLMLLQASKHGGSPMAATTETEKFLPANVSLCGLNVKATTSGVNSIGSTGESHKFQTLCSPNIVLNICGTDAFITICSPRGRSGVLCRILFVMESHRLHVVNAHISTTDDTNLFMLHAQSADMNHLSNPDMLNITLQDLTTCLRVTQ